MERWRGEGCELRSEDSEAERRTSRLPTVVVRVIPIREQCAGPALELCLVFGTATGMTVRHTFILPRRRAHATTGTTPSTTPISTYPDSLHLTQVSLVHANACCTSIISIRVSLPSSALSRPGVRRRGPSPWLEVQLPEYTRACQQFRSTGNQDRRVGRQQGSRPFGACAR
jgi:hypothetical protein